MKIARIIKSVSLGVALSLVVGCIPVIHLHHSDPVAGWTHRKHMDFGPTYGSWITNTIPQAITDDYNAYIKKHKLAVLSGPLGYYEDGKGKRAIQFEVLLDNWWRGQSGIGYDTLWIFTLIYDRENMRTDVVKRYDGKISNW